MMDFLLAFFGAASYSIFGFILGWLVGYEARILREAGVIEMMRSPDSPHHKDDSLQRPRHRTFGAFLVFLAVLTLFQSAYFTYQQRTVTECLSDYNETMAEVQNLRSTWNEQDRQALIEFFHAYEGAAPNEVRQREFDILIDTYERNTVNRQETPLPRLKSCH